MSDFTRSRGCGAPMMTAAEETALRSSACATSVAASECASSCGCASSCPTVRPSCPCGGNSGGNNGGGSSEEGCGCCKASMRQALRLLCSNQISDLLDFDGFAFVTDDLVVGAQPVTMGPMAKDNLSELSGTFRRFSPCNCDLIDVEGTAYGPFGSLIEVEQATLCALSAIVFQVTESTSAPCNCDCLTTPEARYRRVRDLLQCELNSVNRACGECVCHCDCTDDCCCAEGVLAALSGLSLNKRATLIAGLLALRNVTVLGTIGNVLVLGNDEEYRFYFVCANKVEMLA